MATSLLNKILIIIVGIILITLCSSSSVFALDNVIQKGDGFLATANPDSPINEDALKSTSDYIYNILFTIAVVLAVAIGMIIGIQFITGGVAEQAKVKETLVPYVIGVFVVFASFTIWKIAVSIGNDVAPTPEGQGTYVDVMRITEEQIKNMTYEERMNYYESVLNAIKEENNGETEKTDRMIQLEKRKAFIEYINEMESKYSFWYNYIGNKSEEQAYQQLINTDINSLKTTAEISNLMMVINNTKRYFSDNNEQQKVNKLSELYDNLEKRRLDVQASEIAGLEPEDTVLVSEYDISNGKYGVRVNENAEFKWDKVRKVYVNGKSDVIIKLINGNAESYLDSITWSSETDEMKTLQINGKEFLCKKLSISANMDEYYICYQIDDSNLYTVEVTAMNTNEDDLMNSIATFLNPNITKIQ